MRTSANLAGAPDGDDTEWVKNSRLMSKTSRIFELLNVLRARRRPVTATDLADELGVSPRSIYRDIETLRSLGAPIEGQAGIGFHLRAGFFLPEFAFSPDELDALILGLGWVQQRADPALARCSESALAKIVSARSHGLATGQEPPALMTAAARAVIAGVQFLPRHHGDRTHRSGRRQAAAPGAEPAERRGDGDAGMSKHSGCSRHGTQGRCRIRQAAPPGGSRAGGIARR